MLGKVKISMINAKDSGKDEAIFFSIPRKSLSCSNITYTHQWLCRKVGYKAKWKMSQLKIYIHCQASWLPSFSPAGPHSLLFPLFFSFSFFLPPQFCFNMYY